MKIRLILLAAQLLVSAEMRGGELADPLLAFDGTKITTATQWRERRRPELLEWFAREMYGRSPGKPSALVSEVFERDPQALGGKATRIQVAIHPGGKAGPRMDLLVYVPNHAKGPVPAILGLNFWGNHTLHADPGIRITESWVDDTR
ncbi:acetylxylan esterase, partial [bacterium]|nr:acetylxylan esterase [bacterium]